MGVRTLQDVGDLMVQDETPAEVEDLQWYKRPLLGDPQNVVQLENFAPLKATRYKKIVAVT